MTVFGIHAASVKPLTDILQGCLNHFCDDVSMREFETEAGRVRWAIEGSGRTLVQLAAEMGCTHATLSQWQTGSTGLAGAKVGLVIGFCKAVNINMQWLLTGEGPARSTYAAQESELVTEARLLVRERPELVESAYRVLRALEGKT
jgi:transcriptional regulator with XRE-family HTH domain